MSSELSLKRILSSLKSSISYEGEVTTTSSTLAVIRITKRYTRGLFPPELFEEMSNVFLQVDKVNYRVIVCIKNKDLTKKPSPVAYVEGISPYSLQIGWITGLNYVRIPDTIDKDTIAKIQRRYVSLLPFETLCTSPGTNFKACVVTYDKAPLRCVPSTIPSKAVCSRALDLFISKHLSDNPHIEKMCDGYGVALDDIDKCMKGVESLPVSLSSQFGTAQRLFPAVVSSYVGYDFESLSPFKPDWIHTPFDMDKSAGLYFSNNRMMRGRKQEAWYSEYVQLQSMLLQVRAGHCNMARFITAIQFKLEVTNKDKTRIFFMVPLVQYMISHEVFKDFAHLLENRDENFIGFQFAYGGFDRWKGYWDFSKYDDYYWMEGDIRRKDNHAPWCCLMLFYEMMSAVHPSYDDPVFNYFRRVDQMNTCSKILHWFGQAYRMVVGGLPSGHYITSLFNTEHIRWIGKAYINKLTGSYFNEDIKFAVQGDNICFKIPKKYFPSKDAFELSIINFFQEYGQTLREVFIYNSPYTPIGEIGWSFLKRQVTEDGKIHRARRDLYVKSVKTAKELNIVTYSHKLVGLVWQCPYDDLMYDYFHSLWEKVNDTPDRSLYTEVLDDLEKTSIARYMSRADFKGIPAINQQDLSVFPSKEMIRDRKSVV